VLVEKLAPDVGRHARDAASAELVLLTLDREGERALHDDIHLLLAQVAVDAAALAGTKEDEVQAERCDAQNCPQPLEAVVVLEIERREGDAFLHVAIMVAACCSGFASSKGSRTAA
jgi:hypothetical protein